MGLVESVSIDRGVVRVELVLTDASCVHFASMQTIIRQQVSDLDGVKDVEVTISTAKIWTPDRQRSTSHAVTD